MEDKHGFDSGMEGEDIFNSDDEIDSDIEELLYQRAHYSFAIETTPPEEVDSNNKENGTEVAYPVLRTPADSDLFQDADKVDVEPPTEPEEHENDEWSISTRDRDGKSAAKQPRYYLGDSVLPNIHCYNCDKRGHMAKNCPNPKKRDACFLCGGTGHIRRNCPSDLCYNCDQIGHVSRDCREKRRSSMGACRRCSWKGHFAAECPEIWRQFHVTVKGNEIVKPSDPSAESKKKYCFNCGKGGHFGHDCYQERSSFQAPLSPLVTMYHHSHPVTSTRKTTTAAPSDIPAKQKLEKPIKSQPQKDIVPHESDVTKTSKSKKKKRKKGKDDDGVTDAREVITERRRNAAQKQAEELLSPDQRQDPNRSFWSSSGHASGSDSYCETIDCRDLSYEVSQEPNRGTPLDDSQYDIDDFTVDDPSMMHEFDEHTPPEERHGDTVVMKVDPTRYDPASVSEDCLALYGIQPQVAERLVGDGTSRRRMEQQRRPTPPRAKPINTHRPNQRTNHNNAHIEYICIDDDDDAEIEEATIVNRIHNTSRRDSEMLPKDFFANRSDKPRYSLSVDYEHRRSGHSKQVSPRRSANMDWNSHDSSQRRTNKSQRQRHRNAVNSSHNHRHQNQSASHSRGQSHSVSHRPRNGGFRFSDTAKRHTKSYWT